METQEKTRFEIKLKGLKESTWHMIFSIFYIIKWIFNVVYILLYPLFELIIGLYHILRYLLRGKEMINRMPTEKKERLIQLYETINSIEDIRKKENWGYFLEVKWLIHDMKESLKGE